MQTKEINEVRLKEDKKGNFMLLNTCQVEEEWNVDRYQFLAESNGDKNLCIGMDTVIQCLYVAKSQGLIPPLDKEWWGEAFARLGYMVEYENSETE